MSSREIELILALLNDEDIEALTEMVEESPELLREALREYGYLDEEIDEDMQFLTNKEISGLSKAQRELSEHLSGQLEPPKTVAQIKEIVGADDAAFRQRYSSAQYRPWLSEQLKTLSEAGEIGRFREGRTVLYAESPELAVRHWARLNERFPQELSVSDAAEIKEDTGMPGSVISKAIRDIIND